MYKSKRAAALFNPWKKYQNNRNVDYRKSNVDDSLVIWFVEKNALGSEVDNNPKQKKTLDPIMTIY